MKHYELSLSNEQIILKQGDQEEPASLKEISKIQVRGQKAGAAKVLLSIMSKNGSKIVKVQDYHRKEIIEHIQRTIPADCREILSDILSRHLNASINEDVSPPNLFREPHVLVGRQHESLPCILHFSSGIESALDQTSNNSQLLNPNPLNYDALIAKMISRKKHAKQLYDERNHALQKEERHSSRLFAIKTHHLKEEKDSML